MKKLALMAALAVAALIFPAQMNFAEAKVSIHEVSSPDGDLTVSVTVGNEIAYMVSHRGATMVDWSEVSMTLGDGSSYGKMPGRPSVKKVSVDEVIGAQMYKKAEVMDKYNQMTLKFKKFDLVFRVYDDGVAYRFVSKSKKDFTVVSEEAVFNFPEDWTAYIPYVKDFDGNGFERQFYNSFENTYSHTALSQWDVRRLAFLPITVEASDGRKVCITEADLRNYPGMYLHNAAGATPGADETSNAGATPGAGVEKSATPGSGAAKAAGQSLKGVFAGVPDRIEQGGHNMLQGEVRSRKGCIAECGPGEVFPWRVIIVTEEDKQLADNDMVYRLAAPADENIDFSWVKPGKVAWEWWNDWNLYGVDFVTGVNTRTYEYYIDFASEHGIEYVILDEGWSVNLKADLMQVVPEIDLEHLVDYAGQRNVGLILWAGYLAFERDMEKVCRHYSEMGIKGFKVDFMDRDDQKMVQFHERAAEMGAKYHLLMDFHGTYKPTGLHRTWPNVVNYEGVHGLEQMKWSSPEVDQVTYDVTIPFVRMVAGPMDYTQGAMRNASRSSYQPSYSEPMSQGTRCRQLAEYVVFESPVNMLCDSPSNYMREPECTEFIAGIPEVWDETVALDGKIAEYVVTARRKGDVWYVGGMTDWNARSLTVDLSCLGEGEFTVELYRDGVNAGKAGRDYAKVVMPVPADRKMEVEMAPGGGFAMKINRKASGCDTRKD